MSGAARTRSPADEAWKVLACARSYQNIDDTISRLVYNLTEAGSNTNLGLSELRQMTGAQIVDGLLARQREDLHSIHEGLHDQGDKGTSS